MWMACIEGPVYNEANIAVSMDVSLQKFAIHVVSNIFVTLMWEPLTFRKLEDYVLRVNVKVLCVILSWTGSHYCQKQIGRGHKMNAKRVTCVFAWERPCGLSLAVRYHSLRKNLSSSISKLHHTMTRRHYTFELALMTLWLIFVINWRWSCKLGQDIICG
jgi:hypothetical protein